MAISAALLGGIISAAATAASATGQAISVGKANKRAVKFGREQMDWQAEQADIQRQFQLDTYENYQSPQALRSQYEEAGMNPYLAMASNSVGSVNSSASAPAAAAPHSFQTPDWDFSNVGSSINSIAQAIATSKEAEQTPNKIASEIDLNNATAAKLRGDTNWLNKDIEKLMTPDDKEFYKHSVVQQREAETKRMDLANKVLDTQVTLQNLDIEAKEISNKYLDEQQQNELALQAANFWNLMASVDEKKANTKKLAQDAATSYAQMLSYLEDVAGKRIDNRIASETAASYIRAANSSNALSWKQNSIDMVYYGAFKKEFFNQLKAEGVKISKQSEHWLFSTLFSGAGTSVAGAVAGGVTRGVVPVAGKFAK